MAGGDGGRPLVGKAKGQFGKGRDPLERYKGKPDPGPIPPLVSVEGEGLLGAFRHVLANPDGRVDVTTEEKAAREWLKDDRAGFFREKAKLEAAEMAMKGRQSGAGAADEDVGSAAALGLVDELLARHREGR